MSWEDPHVNVPKPAEFLIEFLASDFPPRQLSQVIQIGLPLLLRNTASAIAIITISIDSHRPHCLWEGRGRKEKEGWLEKIQAKITFLLPF